MHEMFWTLVFDGRSFNLLPASELAGRADDRVNEEGVETVLMHWGDKLLPGTRVWFTSREAVLNRVADLAGVDRLGRTHLVEIKSTQATAGKKELGQLLSYLVQHAGNREAPRAELLARCWYGQRANAAYMLGLIAGVRLGNMRSPAHSRSARQPEKWAERVESLAAEAAELSKMRVDEGALMEFALAELARLSGHDRDGAIADANALWQTFQEQCLWPGWQPAGKRVVWLIAPNTKPAFDEASNLLDRNVDIRFVNLDIRRVERFKKWSISVSLPDGSEWPRADAVGDVLQQVLERHWHGMVPRPLGHCAEISCKATGGHIGWAGLAGPAGLSFKIGDACVKWEWHSDWWTEGHARSKRDQVNGVHQWLIKRHPASLPSIDGGQGSRAFIDAATALADDAWQRLVDVGATSLDRWAFYAPAQS